jgi:hypothetical protein
MPRAASPNSRTIPVTIKVTRAEEKFLKSFGGADSTGRGLRRVFVEYIKSGKHILREGE